MGQDFDLWGDPIPDPVERRGRPKHVPTDENRVRVAVLRALKHTEAEIAAALGLSEKTLRKNYSRELREGLAQKRAELMVRLWRQVEKGNVSAMKEFKRQIDQVDIDRSAAMHRGAAKPVKLGKKEAADMAARTAEDGTSWAGLLN